MYTKSMQGGIRFMSQISNHIGELIEQVTTYRDQGQWQKLEQFFTETAFIDDEALTKTAPGNKSIQNVLYTWKRLVRDLYYGARHKLGAIRVERKNRKEVAAESDIEASYYTTKGSRRYVLRMKGIYQYTFRKVAGRWKIADMRLIVKNTSFEPVGA